MNIEKATVVDTPDMLLATYKVDIIDTTTKQEEIDEPVLIALRKWDGMDASAFFRNQVNRIPITVFK